MRVLYRKRQLQALLREMVETLGRLDRDWREVLNRDPGQSYDGYPRSSMGGNGGHGVADPTGLAVVMLVDGSPQGSDMAKMFGYLHQAAELLEKADGLRAKLLPPEKAKAEDPTGWCASCLRLKVDRQGRKYHSPVWRDGAQECRWCYRWKLAQGEWPSLELLAKHARGERIFLRDIGETPSAT